MSVSIAGAAAFVAAGLVKGVLGIGLPLVAVPLLATMFEASTAVALMIVPVLASNTLLLVRHGRVASTVRRYWTLLVPLIAFTLLGGQFLAAFDAKTGAIVLAAVVLLFCATRATTMNFAVPPRSERWLNPVMGTVAGVLGGVSNFFGPPLILYLSALRLDKDEFVGTIALFFMIGGLPLYASLTFHGVLSPNIGGLSCLAAVPVMVGVYAGQRLRDRVSQSHFERLMLIVLVFTALNLLRRGMS